MKNIVKIGIRLFLVFITFNFINSFSVTVLNFINGFRVNNRYEIKTSEFINAIIPFFVIWAIYIIILIILWMKSEKISVKIVGEKDYDTINLSLNMENLLSIGIILLSLYLIIDTIPKLFAYIANYIVNKTRFVQDYIKNYTISQIIEIMGIIIKIIVSVVLIKHRNDIVIFLNKKQDNKNKSNVA
jgi:hypothetical protein